MQVAREEWRKKGAVGKLHNIVVFIRASVQRQEEFRRTTVDGRDNGKYDIR